MTRNNPEIRQKDKRDNWVFQRIPDGEILAIAKGYGRIPPKRLSLEADKVYWFSVSEEEGWQLLMIYDHGYGQFLRHRELRFYYPDVAEFEEYYFYDHGDHIRPRWVSVERGTTIAWREREEDEGRLLCEQGDV